MKNFKLPTAKKIALSVLAFLFIAPFLVYAASGLFADNTLANLENAYSAASMNVQASQKLVEETTAKLESDKALACNLYTALRSYKLSQGVEVKTDNCPF